MTCTKCSVTSQSGRVQLLKSCFLLQLSCRKSDFQISVGSLWVVFALFYFLNAYELKALCALWPWKEKKAGSKPSDLVTSSVLQLKLYEFACQLSNISSHLFAVTARRSNIGYPHIISANLSPGIQEFPDSIKNCKGLTIVEASVNRMPKWANLPLTFFLWSMRGKIWHWGVYAFVSSGSQKASRCSWTWHSSTWTTATWSSYQPASAGRSVVRSAGLGAPNAPKLQSQSWSNYCHEYIYFSNFS